MNLSLKKIFQALRNRLALIVFLQFIAVTSSVIYALVATEKYTSLSVLASSSKSNVSSSISGIAALAGVSIGGGVDQSQDSIEYIRSRSMLKHLLELDPTIAQEILAAKGYDKENKKTIFDERIFKNNEWVRKHRGNNGSEPHYLELYLPYTNMLKSQYDKLTGMVYLSVTHESPVFAHKLLSMIVTQVNQIVKQQDVVESQRAVKFLNEAISDVNSFELVAAINKLAEKQIETQMHANSQTHYVLKIIDEPFIPIQRSYPRRSLIVIITSIISFVLIIGFVLIKDREFILED